MTNITKLMRTKRSANIDQHGQFEVTCPSCKGKGSRTEKQTRVAGVAMRKHLSEKHASGCSCPRSTVAVEVGCNRCGGYGTVPRAKDA